MLDLRIKQGRRHVPLFDLPAHLGRDHARKEIGDAVEGLIAFLDELGGDADLEADTSDFEPDADAMGDPAWIEWHTRGRYKNGRYGGERLARDRIGNALHEDAEDDDPAEANGDEHDTNNAEDDEFAGLGSMRFSGPGCTISDPDLEGDAY